MFPFVLLSLDSGNVIIKSCGLASRIKKRDFESAKMFFDKKYTPKETSLMVMIGVGVDGKTVKFEDAPRLSVFFPTDSYSVPPHQ